MKGKERFRQLCAGDSPLPLFMQAWWLDAVAGEEGWDAIVLEEDGQVKAAWPYAYKTVLGEARIRPSELTQAGGAYLFYPVGQKYESRLSYEHEICLRLIEELEARHRVTYFKQLFHPGFTNWLPFYWKGYRQTTLYTYRIEAGADPEAVLAGMSAKLRNELRKAERSVTVREAEDVELLCSLVKLTFARQGKKPPFELDTVRRIFEASRREGRGLMLVAEDPPGEACAAIFLVEDRQTAYYLLSGADPERRSNNAVSLLLWRAIRRSLEAGRTFDFEGSVNQAIEKFFRSFGAVQTPYMCIFREDGDFPQSPLRRALKFAHRSAKRLARLGRR
jgi:hypothetical protein